MNIEELMNVEVTSVSDHEQSLSKTAAAVFVITEEDPILQLAQLAGRVSSEKDYSLRAPRAGSDEIGS
jgi:hypothetical protein